MHEYGGLTIALALALIGCSVVAQAAPDIWSRPVMKQPFDKEPLREIRIPEWVEKLNGVTYCFSVADSESREFAVKEGAQISEVFFVDPFYVYYDSKLLSKRSPHVPPGKLEQDIAEYKRLGVKILGVAPPGLLGEAYFNHPEWRRIGTNTTEIPQADPEKDPYGGPLCMTGPYGDFFIDLLAEIVTKYPDVAAFSFDGIHDYGCCYCANCRDSYRADTGLEIPDADMNDPAFRSYLHWLDRRMESLVVRMQTRLKSINPNIALITWTTNAGRFGHFLSIPRNMPARMNLLFDVPDQEFWMDETNRGNTVVPAFANAYMWAVTNHRVAYSSPYLMSHGNPYGGDSFPPHEYLRRALFVLTYGCRPSGGLSSNKARREMEFSATREVRKRDPWVGHKQPEPWAAMVMSDNTNCFYGRDPGKVEERYLSNVFGTFRTAIEEHLPMTVINDWNLNSEDLAKFRVLVLPNTACMNEGQAEAIREFVRNGGGLVASVDTSLFDEMGNPREDFLLSDLFGVSYQGVAVGSGEKEEIDPNFAMAIDQSYWDKRRSIFDFRTTEHALFDLDKLREYLPDGVSCFKGQAVAVSVGPDAQPAGTITAREAGAQPLPSIAARTFGKGRVVYMAAGFDSAYYLYPYPYYRLIMASAMRWAASEQPRITVDAPMCVHSTFYRQKKEGERLVVHLYNNINSTGNHAKPDDDVPLREEVVPIHDIRVSFRDYNITRIRLEPEGIDLEATRTGDTVQVTVPRLSIHSMVVAELKQ